MYELPIENKTIAVTKKNSNSFIKLLLYACITVIFFSDWLYFVLGVGSRYISWIPELFSMFLSIYIPAVMAVNKEWRLPTKYTIILLIYILHIAMGFLVNSVAIGPMIAGTRQFCRFIPIFILPAVIYFDEKDITNLLKYLLILALIQFPVTIWQRFFVYAHNPSGDPIGGTLGANTSGVLSIFLLMVLSFMTTFYLKKGLTLRYFVTFSILLFIPITLNETKVSLPLLPLAFLLPVLFLKKNITKAPFRILNLFLILSVTLFLFITIYNSFSNRNIIQFYSQEDQVGSYSDARIVPILTALDKVFHDGLKTTIYGYGAGNVSVSYSKNLESKLLTKLSAYNTDNVSITKMLWETGYLGTLIFFMLIALLFLDSIRFSKLDNLSGTIATSMSVAIIILAITFFYTKPLDQNIFVYLLFFLNGYLVSNPRYRI